MKTIKFFSIFMFIATLCVFIPSFAISGGGIEPGGGCPTLVRLKYVPPAFTGDLELYFVGNAIDATGVLHQVGNPGCTVTITATPFINGVTSTEFQALKPRDVRQRCVVKDNLQFSFNGCDGDYDGIQYVESVGVGNLRDDESNVNHKTARAVAMPLEE